MKYQKFLIGYLDNGSGIQTSLKPWAITDNSFQNLVNMYVLRGRVKKRFGSIPMSDLGQIGTRLRLNTSASYSSPTYSGTVPGTVFGIGQMFSVNEDIFTVYQTGTPAAMLASNAATSGTYDTTSGAFTITGEASGQDVFFYPATPVMGLTQLYSASAGTYGTFAFDTQFSYIFDPVAGTWGQITSGASTWTGTDYDFFWMTNYRGLFSSISALWVSNFNVADGIRYFDGTTWVQPILNYSLGTIVDTTDGTGTASGTLTGTFFIGQVFTIGITSFKVTASSGALTPTSTSANGSVGMGAFDTGTGVYSFTGAQANAPVYFTGNNYIQTAQCIAYFKNRLVLFNTVLLVNGVSTNFPFQCRFSAVGNPLNPGAWMDNFPGNGGFINAPTQEAIVTVQFIKDRLIVYFESSTYELIYNNNQTTPFAFQKINTELGAISTFSEIPFDKVVIGIDDNGIHGCNGANVDRIDMKIPQYPFTISNEENGQDRVCGIRDYYNEMAYWTVSTNNRNSSFYFPNQVLVYNYVNDSWATIEDSFTTFGYFFLPPISVGLTWGETSTPWGENGNQWNSSSSGLNNTTIKSVLAGNQQGFVSVIQSDTFSNSSNLQITNFVTSTLTVTCVNHNLSLNQYLLFTNMNGLTFIDNTDPLNPVTLPNLMARVSSDTVNNATTSSFVIDCGNVAVSGTYLGGGTAQLVSNINVLTKQYNFFTEADRNMALTRVDFLVDRTSNGQITADYLTSSTPITLASNNISSIVSPGPIPGTSALETFAYPSSNFEQFQERLWHPVYMYAEGECIQLQLYMTPDQMLSYTLDSAGNPVYVALQDVEIHAMIFYVRPTTNRMQ